MTSTYIEAESYEPFIVKIGKQQQFRKAYLTIYEEHDSLVSVKMSLSSLYQLKSIIDEKLKELESEELLKEETDKCCRCGAEATVASEGSLYCHRCAMDYAK